MTRKEAIKVLTYLREIIKTTPKVLCKLPNVEERKKENIIALRMAIEALSADRPTGEWIFNPKDAIELMFTLPKCSKCGCESADCGNFCSNCGARMKGGAE